ncbi:hypothetical protein D6C95_04674 [Aureobasidium pullulans]|nr:hypothetical protein D6C95_04674 [Aureobasidium pullulans]
MTGGRMLLAKYSADWHRYVVGGRSCYFSLFHPCPEAMVLSFFLAVCTRLHLFLLLASLFHPSLIQNLKQ